MSTYTDIMKAIRDECAKINISFLSNGDGRITSAVKESEYLNLLEKGLKEHHPSLTFKHQPKERWWWDLCVNDIPINLKLTTGGTDNAFNKVAIIYSLTGKVVEKRNMNFNQFYKTIKETPKKTERDPMTEYHYLVVNKSDGKILLKSIFDIHSYKSNPCNDLQINWENEFRNLTYTITHDSYNEKVQQLLKTVQTSVKQAVASQIEFANANIDTDFPK